MAEEDTLSAILNGWFFFEVLKVFAVLLAARKRQAYASTEGCWP